MTDVDITLTPLEVTAEVIPYTHAGQLDVLRWTVRVKMDVGVQHTVLGGTYTVTGTPISTIRIDPEKIVKPMISTYGWGEWIVTSL